MYSDIIATGSLIVAGLAYLKSSQAPKEIFLNMLRTNIIQAKHIILELENKTYEHIKVIKIIEKLHDLTLYQGYKKEKNKYLSDIQKNYLSNIQEEIEDSVSLIVNNCDRETNQQQIVKKLNNLLEIF